MSDTLFTPPIGFDLHLSPSPFVQSLGPIFKKVADNGMAVIAIRISEQHLNLHGITHGGFVATLIDNAMGYNVAKALGSAIVTAHMAIDYLSTAKLGDWVEAEVKINRCGRRMCFAECTLKNGDALMARASCILAPKA